MSYKCTRCGMNSGWLPVCPTCQQNALIEKQTEYLRGKNLSDSPPPWGFLSFLLVTAIVCFTYVYFSIFW
jgi:DNA-directed RNA polymerase subunit RPC12/RpoP